MWHFPRGGPHTNLTRTTPWVAIKPSRTGAVKEPAEQMQLTEDSGGPAEQLSQAPLESRRALARTVGFVSLNGLAVSGTVVPMVQYFPQGYALRGQHQL